MAKTRSLCDAIIHLHFIHANFYFIGLVSAHISSH